MLRNDHERRRKREKKASCFHVSPRGLASERRKNFYVERL